MKEYVVEIKEIYKRTIIVPAESNDEAQNIATSLWFDARCVIDTKDFHHAEFTPKGEITKDAPSYNDYERFSEEDLEEWKKVWNEYATTETKS